MRRLTRIKYNLDDTAASCCERTESRYRTYALCGGLSLIAVSSFYSACAAVAVKAGLIKLSALSATQSSYFLHSFYVAGYAASAGGASCIGSCVLPDAFFCTPCCGTGNAAPLQNERTLLVNNSMS